MWQTIWQIRIRDIRDDRLDQSDKQTTKHGTYDVADASQHGCGKGNQSKLEADIKFCYTILQFENKRSSSCQPSADKKGSRDDTIDVNSHQRGRVTVLCNSTHRSTNRRSCDQPL